MAEDTLVDFAVVVFREEGQWQVGSLPHRAAEDLAASAARRPPAALGGADPGGLLVRRRLLPRRSGPDGDHVRLMISDATAAGDWPVAREALDLVGETEPDDDDESVAPAGDLEIFADLGMSSMELAAICSDLELYPDEMLGQIAARIGFGPQFESVVDDDLT